MKLMRRLINSKPYLSYVPTHPFDGMDVILAGRLPLAVPV
jgi:hypothetical protein